MFVNKIIIFISAIIGLSIQSEASVLSQIRGTGGDLVASDGQREELGLARSSYAGDNLDDIGGGDGDIRLFAVLSDTIDEVRMENSRLARVAAVLDGLTRQNSLEEVLSNISQGCLERFTHPLCVVFELVKGTLGAITATGIYGLGESKAWPLSHLISRFACAAISGIDLAILSSVGRRVEQYVRSAIPDKCPADAELLTSDIASPKEELIIKRVALQTVQSVSALLSAAGEKEPAELQILRELICTPQRGSKCLTIAKVTLNIASVAAGVLRAICEVVQDVATFTKVMTVIAYALESGAAISLRSHDSRNSVANVRLALITCLTIQLIETGRALCATSYATA
jgi:hypothetical protein